MTTIKLKNGSGAPTAGDLAQGEPALDLTNKRLYTEDSDGTVIEVGTNPSTINIDAGTIDGTVIGGTTAAAITGTTITGTSFVTSGDVSFGDNDKAVFGAGSDLQIYHDGSNSYITDTTGGNFFINEEGAGYLMMKGSDLYFRNPDSADMIHAQSGGYVKLYHNGVEKLATTSTGIDVTGTVTADGLTLQASEDVVSWASGNGIVQAPSNLYVRSSGTGDVLLQSDSTAVAKFEHGGDISFYEDTGTTAKLFWDASAESLGIGTSSPIANSGYANLTLNGNSGGQLHFTDNDVKKATIASSVDDLYVQSGSQTIFRNGGFTSSDEAMRIDASGNLLVATTSNPVSSSSVEGLYYEANNYFAVATAGVTAYFNRQGSDGDVVHFRKNGSSVGSVGTKLSDGGTSDGELFITSGNTGLFFDDIGSYIRPCNGSAALRDNLVDLGKSDSRFKDLYLSGGVYLGGTGSANKLDDYEEGTWTSLTATNNITTYGAFTGRYTKVGNIVHLSGELAGISAGTGNRFFEFTAPFVQYAATNISIGVCNNYPRGNRRSGQVINASSGNNTVFYVTWNNDSSQSSDSVRFQITYETT